MVRSMKPETIAIHTQAQRTQYKESAVPVYLTSGFVFDDTEDMRTAFTEEQQRNIYSRFSNPNTSELAEKVALLEGAESGLALSTGMAAVFSTFAALLESGDHIVACRSVFGSTHTVFSNILPRWNIHTSYFSADTPELAEQLITPATKILYLETPTNPACDILDIAYFAQLAEAHGILLVVDNCFATPILQQPITHGAHLVIHSATKYIDGQGRSLGGLVAGRADLIRKIYVFARNTGPSLSPFNAWLLSKSIETLPLRMQKHSENAEQLASWLEQQEQVEQVNYPFLDSHPSFEIARKQMSSGGGMLSFEIKGGIECGSKFINSLQLCLRSANLGDARSIVTHPASSTHSKLSAAEKAEVGITDGLIRFSVGLEHIDDIVNDISHALQRAQA